MDMTELIVNGELTITGIVLCAFGGILIGLLFLKLIKASWNDNARTNKLDTSTHYTLGYDTRCGNCGFESELRIPNGMNSDDYKEKCKCTNCECLIKQPNMETY